MSKVLLLWIVCLRIDYKIVNRVPILELCGTPYTESFEYVRLNGPLDALLNIVIFLQKEMARQMSLICCSV